VTESHQPLFPSSKPGDGAEPGLVGYPQIGATDMPPGPGGTGRPTIARPVPRSWLIGAAAALIVSAVILGVVFASSSPSEQASIPKRVDSSAPPDSIDSGSTAARTTPTQSVPPAMLQTPDSFGEICGAGFHLNGQSGWASNAGRGSAETSCSFARSVLLAYWNQYGSASVDRRTVTAAGRVPCPSTGGQCAGDDFIMECATRGGDPWITCTGGRNARVYIY
jgi:serine/threonine-protein kinase